MSLDIYLEMKVDTGGNEPYELELAWKNITHNVSPMWSKAGCYEALYESHGKPASEYIEVLRAAVADMEAKPDEYKALDASNGWGRYIHALPWLQEWLEACEKHPKATIYVSR